VTTIEYAQALHHDGYTLLPALIDQDRVLAARHAIDALRAQHWDYQGVLDHYKCVFNRDPFWLPFLDLPAAIDLAEAVLGTDCHVIGQTAWRCHPGFIGSDLHLDHLPQLVIAMPPKLLDDPAFELPMTICTLQLYLDDIDEALAPTRVIPGSHRAGRPPQAGETHWRGKPPHPIHCRAGDALVFRSELWHGGSPNLDPHRSRYMLQVHYGRRMVAQKFSPYLEWRFDPAIIAAATPRQRRLLGDHAEAEYD
jgi:ectoine hydroxylase-related dioxygenase (phytanoyl-CoA dioxygenase family)